MAFCGRIAPMSEEAPHWFKSTHSSFVNDCVEVAFPGAVWRKSTHSSFENNCVEVAFDGAVPVMVRDTQNREVAVLGVGAREWSALVTLITDRSG